MRDYNGFTGEQRAKAGKWLAAEWAAGRRPRPVECCVCGQDRGPMDAHAEDYSEPFGDHTDRFPICYRCHMLLHCRHLSERAWEDYCAMLAAGLRFVAIPNRAFQRFMAEHFNGRTAVTERPAVPPAGFAEILAARDAARAKTGYVDPVDTRPKLF